MAIVNVRVDCSPFGLGLPMSLAGMEGMMYFPVGFLVRLISFHQDLLVTVVCGGLIGVATLLPSCPPSFIPWACSTDVLVFYLNVDSRWFEILSSL